jgi:K+-sensing histidine kinase KdpD
LGLLLQVQEWTGGNESSDKALLEKARAQVKRLRSLIERLLDMTHIRAGSFALCREDMDLCEVIRDVVSRFSMEADNCRIFLSASAADSRKLGPASIRSGDHKSRF